MMKWEKRLSLLCGAILLLMAVGHGFASVGVAQNIEAAHFTPDTSVALRVVWLTISAMLAMFGVVMLRTAIVVADNDYFLTLAVGSVLVTS